MPPKTFVVAVLALAASFLASDVSADSQPPTAAQMMDDLMFGRVPIGGPFSLVDQNGRRRSDSEFRGRLMIVYFGYTFCPDVCPTDLMAITQALDELGPLAEGIQPVFITLDPERDDQVMAEYLSAFHKSFIGLTGSPREIREVANAYKAFYVRMQDPQTGEYSIDHSGVIYLLGRDGKYLGFMPPQTAPDHLIEILRKYLAP
jgi:protein SCO1